MSEAKMASVYMAAKLFQFGVQDRDLSQYTPDRLPSLGLGASPFARILTQACASVAPRLAMMKPWEVERRAAHCSGDGNGLAKHRWVARSQ